MAFEAMFQPIQIGKLTIRNRVLSTAHAEVYATDVAILGPADDAVFVGFLRVALLDRQDIAAGLFIQFHHARQATTLGLHDHVRQQKRKGLRSHEIARAPDGMAKAKRRLLAGEAGGARLRLKLVEQRELRLLAAFGQGVHQFDLDVEIIFDDAFVASGHENQVLDAGLPRLIHDILDDGAVHHSEHFLWDRFRGRQEPRSKAGDGEDCLADFMHREIAPDYISDGR